MDESKIPGSGAPPETGAAGAATGEEGKFSKAREFVETKYDAASSAVRDRYNAVREKAQDVDLGAMADDVRGYVRENPGKSLLISLGVGFVVGLLLRSGDDE